MPKSEIEKYKDSVAARLSKILPFLQDYALGDFSKIIEIAEKEDEFTEISVGISLMADDIKELLKAETASTARLSTGVSKMIDVIQKVARGDYSVQVKFPAQDDDLDSLAVGLNRMIDEIRNESTERNRAEKELTSSEERLRILFEYAPDAYYLNDLKGILIDGNKAAEKMMGFEKQELIGKSFLKLKILSLEQVPKAARLLAKNAMGKPTGPDEFILKRKDDSRVTVEIRTFPVRIKGKILVLGIARDITERKKAEEALKESEQKYKEVTDSINDVIFTVDLSGNYTFVNKAAESLTGYSNNELLNMNMRQIVAGKKDLNMLLSEINKAAKGEKVHGRYEYHITTKNGGIRYVEINTSKQRDRSGRLFGFFGVARDISERKKAEEELKAMNEELQSINETLQKREHDLGERVKELNCLYGISKLVSEPGISLEEIFQGIVDIIPPSWQYPEITCARILLNNQEFRTKNFKKTTWMQTNDIIMNGEHIGTLEVCYLRKKPEIDEGPFLKEERHLINAIAERVGKVIESKRAEEALQNSEERFRLFFENAPDYCYMVSPEGRTLNINASALAVLGYKKEDVIGKSLLTTIYAPSSIEKAKKIFMKWKETGKLRNEELNIITKAGKERTVLLNVDAVRSEDGKVLHTISVQTDITDRKKAQEQIKASLEEKEFLLKEIHHRVKNNMQVISSLLRIQASNIKDEKILEMFNVIHGRIRSMSLLYEMLYKSRDMARIDLSEYIRELTAHLFSMYRAKGGLLSLKLNVKDVYLDAQRAIPCGLIITELVSNSLKHAFPNGKKGEIFVEMFLDRGKKFSLIIGDTGRGFPEELDFNETQSLGMQLVTGLVDQIDGTIKLNREKGTEFKIVF